MSLHSFLICHPIVVGQEALCSALNILHMHIESIYCYNLVRYCFIQFAKASANLGVVTSHSLCVVCSLCNAIIIRQCVMIMMQKDLSIMYSSHHNTCVYHPKQATTRVSNSPQIPPLLNLPPNLPHARNRVAFPEINTIQIDRKRSEFIRTDVFSCSFKQCLNSVRMCSV
jgi:hypothetical protein